MKKPLVFLDADVIFAGAAAPTKHGASHVVLRLGEVTLIECVTSTQVVTEEDRPCLWGLRLRSLLKLWKPCAQNYHKARMSPSFLRVRTFFRSLRERRRS